MEVSRQLEELESRQQIVPDNTVWQMPAGQTLANMQPVDEEYPAEFDQMPADRVLAMLADVTEAGDARAYVKVSRIADSGMVWCKDYSALQFEQGGYEMIRRQWGPGLYKVVLYGMVPGTKRFTIRTKAEVELAAPMHDDTASPVPAPASGLEALVAQLAQGQQRLMEILSAPKEVVDPMAQMTQMLTMAKLMKDAFAPPPAPAGGGIKDIIESVQAIMDVKDMVSPPAVPETPMGMVSQMLPLLQTAMQQRQPAAAPPPQPAPQLRPLVYPPVAMNPSPGSAAPAVPTPSITHTVTPVLLPPTPGEEVNPLAIIKLRGQLATLFTMAREGKPTEDGAELLYEHLPDDFIVLLQQENWFDMLKAVASEDIEPIKEWLTAARAGLFAIFEEDAKADAEAAGAAISPTPTPPG